MHDFKDILLMLAFDFNYLNFKYRIIQFYNSISYKQSKKTSSNLTSNSILNTPQHSPSSQQTQNKTSSSNRILLTPISINSNRKRSLKKNNIDNLTDKNIN